MPLLSRLALIFTFVFVSLTVISGTAAAAPGSNAELQPTLELRLVGSIVSATPDRELPPLLRTEPGNPPQDSREIGFGVTLVLVGGLLGMGLKSRTRPAPAPDFPRAQALEGTVCPADLTTRREEPFLDATDRERRANPPMPTGSHR